MEHKVHDLSQELLRVEKALVLRIKELRDEVTPPGIDTAVFDAKRVNTVHGRSSSLDMSQPDAYISSNITNKPQLRALESQFMVPIDRMSVQTISA